MDTRVCIICGKSFDTAHWRKEVCSPECTDTRDREYNTGYKKEYYRKRHKQTYIPRERRPRQMREGSAYKVIDDPLGIDGGGFRPGSLFQPGEVALMAQMKSIVRGTILERNGQRYEFNGQKLERMT